MPEKQRGGFASRTVGRVREHTNETFTIVTPTGRLQRIGVTDATVVLQATKGDASGIRVSDRVIMKTDPVDAEVAAEVIVLRPSDRYGLPVTVVEPGALTVRDRGGSTQDVDITNATINHTASATVDDIVSGSIMLAMLRVSDDGALTAPAIILLADTTAFGS
jgi:hypothetical protein